MTVLEIDRVTVWRHRHKVLDNVSIALRQGDLLGLIGPNGGGKTTLLSVALGLIKPDSGTVSWFGSRVPAGGRSARIAYVPQALPSFPNSFPATLLEVVASGRAAGHGLFRRFSRADWRAAETALALLGIADLRDRRVRQLSGGQLQRAWIARALAAEPEVLLLDEPTDAIDPENRAQLLQLLRRLNDNGITIMLVSHDLGVVRACATRIAHLDRRLTWPDAQELQELDTVGVH